jgi:serine-type D-Ala-D-Ala carboxypeptidase (penicillin-binding protein 5/6)
MPSGFRREARLDDLSLFGKLSLRRTSNTQKTIVLTLLVIAWTVFPLTFAKAQAPPAAKNPVSDQSRLPTLKQGDGGPGVEDLQRRLNSRFDPSPELDVDGDFGPATHAALERFQRSKGLKPTGVADAKTWSALGRTPASESARPRPVVAPDLTPPPPKQPADPIEGPPFVTAKSWVVADGRTGGVLWGLDESKPLDMASTTKIMTALLVVRQVKTTKGVLEEIVTFSKRADDTPGSTSGVRANERLSVRELLFGMLLPSGNDAAVAFAEHFGGRFARPGVDRDRADPLSLFVAEMNRVAAELALRETHFANPHGLPAEGHHTSARDLAKLAVIAVADPLFAEVVSTRRHASALSSEGATREVVWTNTNRLLAIDGYDGVKTGTTSSAGNCLVASGRRGDRRLIVVILGSTSGDGRYIDARNLFRWSWRQLMNR